MALSDDQKALLRLLAQREQGYDDIAALKGLSVDEVRAEVRAAIAALDAPPPEPPPPPPPPAPVEAPAPAPAPAAEDKPAPAKPKPAAPAKRKPGTGVPVERRRLLALTGGALAVVAIVLGAIALFGGDSGSGSNSASTVAGTELSADEEGKVTQAVLTAPDGGEASGRALFGRVSGQEDILLEVTGEGLEPTGKGESYTVWLYRDPKLSLRVGKAPVRSGRLGARFPIPSELLAYVAGGAFDQVYVSRTSDAEYQREVKRAKKNKAIPRYVGETVLSGKITGPIAEEAAKNQGN